jgi:hypothetical protein
MDHDAIFFTGLGDSLLVSSLSLTGSDFFSKHNHPTFVEWNPMQTLTLQLDTNIIFYEPHDNEEYKLYEQYSIMGGPPITNKIGTWDKSGGLCLSKLNMWERRSDLQGTRLRNAVVTWPHLTDLIYNDLKELVGSKGLFQETLFFLRDALNFTIETVTPDDGQWGSLNKDNQTWSGMVGMLFYKRADLATAGKNGLTTLLFLGLQKNNVLSAGLATYLVFFVIFYMQHVFLFIGIAHTMTRDLAVDFSKSILTSSRTLLSPVLSGAAPPQLWVYLKIFSVSVWLLLVTMLVIVSGISMIMDHYCCR